MEAVRQASSAAGVEELPGPFLDFRDAWGNRIEIVAYENIQFSKRSMPSASRDPCSCVMTLSSRRSNASDQWQRCGAVSCEHT
jgi:hypothetical protein